MKKNTDTKQMLFEMMRKINPTFKPSLNEGPENTPIRYSGKYEVKFLTPHEISVTLFGTPNGKHHRNITEILEYVAQEPAYITVGQLKTFGDYFDYILRRPQGVSEETLQNNRVFRLNLEKALQLYVEILEEDIMGIDWNTNESVNEADKSSYSDALVNDIKVLLGNNTALSPRDIQQLSTDHQISPEEVQQTVDYVISTKQSEQQPLPSNSQEAEEVNDFFKFLKNNPQAESIASLWYVSTLNSGLAKPKQNPMVNRFLKLTKYMFEWERTYAKEIEKVNPEWQIQQRKGDYSQVEGFNIIKRDSKGDEVIDIIPRNPKSIVLILDEAGNVADTLKTGELSTKYAEYFTPSFLAPSKPSGSGVDFRSLKLYATKRIAAGGKEWINPKFKYERYSEYFNQIPKGSE
jgi:hypothetical protein